MSKSVPTMLICCLSAVCPKPTVPYLHSAGKLGQDIHCYGPKFDCSNLVVILDPIWPIPRGFTVPQNRSGTDIGTCLESPLMCRFLGRRARRRRLGTGLQASEKRQGTKSRGAFRVYGDLTGAAMMAGLA